MLQIKLENGLFGTKYVMYNCICKPIQLCGYKYKWTYHESSYNRCLSVVFDLIVAYVPVDIKYYLYIKLIFNVNYCTMIQNRAKDFELFTYLDADRISDQY